jgi:hypothetical protein
VYSFPKIRIAANSRLGLRQIIITGSLNKRLFLNDNQELTIFSGMRRSSFLVNVQDASNTADVIIMHPSSIHHLCIKPECEYGYLITEQGIRLGPMIGIMVEILGGPSKPYAGQTNFIKLLLKNGQELGEICYVFSPYAIDWQRQVVTGYTYGKNGWIKRSYPFPNVVYPRERSYSYSQLILQIRSRFGSLGVKFLNPTMAGKWKTYEIIRNHPQLAGYLPDTRLLTDFSLVDTMVKKYRSAYLKPVIGSKGQKIIRVSLNKTRRGYQYQYQTNKKSIRGTAENLGILRRSLQGIMGKRAYLIQEPINLLTFNGHITDVRVIVQKNHTGRWLITGMGCRMGAKGSITSNIASGGRGYKLSTVLERHFPQKEQRSQIEHDIRFIALESARVLEKGIGTAGEMGIDLGIDVSGKVWFIEANLRPARSLFRLIEEPVMRQQSILNPMLYSRYLAGFTGKEYDK